MPNFFSIFELCSHPNKLCLDFNSVIFFTRKFVGYVEVLFNQRKTVREMFYSFENLKRGITRRDLLDPNLR